MTPDSEKYILYFDDSGTRSLADQPARRADAMDWFALGGVMAKGECVELIRKAHNAFCDAHDIRYALHSTDIRGHRRNFQWLRQSTQRSERFVSSLSSFITSQPMVVTGTIIHRPNYFARYRDLHEGNLWKVDKTAFCILVERAAKFANYNGRKLEVFFEQSGPKEDKAIIEYLRELKRNGPPFNTNRMVGYKPMSAEVFREVVLGDPIPTSKKSPLIQLADLVLYPISKKGFVDDYPPYTELENANMLIDQHIPADLIEEMGIKYSCF